jgi:hypothetical protein
MSQCKTDSDASTVAVTASAKAKLDCAKAAEAEHMVHHFRVLTREQLWEAARVSQATAQALTQQSARPATMKRGLTVYSRGQAHTLSIIDMVTQAVSTGMDPAKPIVIALGRNYKGAHACLGDRWTPVCKVVSDILKCHFMVVLIDEYLTSQMCHSCHNKLIPQFGEPRESTDTAPTVNVMWIVTSTQQRTFWCFCSMFVDGDVRITCVVPTSTKDKCRYQQQLCPKQLKCDCVTEPVPCL